MRELRENMSARSSLSSEKDNTGQVNHVNKPAREHGRGLEGARTEQGKVDKAGGPQREGDVNELYRAEVPFGEDKSESHGDH